MGIWESFQPCQEWDIDGCSIPTIVVAVTPDVVWLAGRGHEAPSPYFRRFSEETLERVLTFRCEESAHWRPEYENWPSAPIALAIVGSEEAAAEVRRVFGEIEISLNSHWGEHGISLRGAAT